MILKTVPTNTSRYVCRMLQSCYMQHLAWEESCASVTEDEKESAKDEDCCRLELLMTSPPSFAMTPDIHAYIMPKTMRFTGRAQLLQAKDKVISFPNNERHRQ